jgi:hypothetical protein
LVSNRHGNKYPCAALTEARTVDVPQSGMARTDSLYLTTTEMDAFRMVTKPAPLATFLAGVSRSETSDAAGSKDKGKPAGRSRAEVGRTVILTLLGQSSGPITREDLAARADLRPEWYDEVLQGLANEKLIEQSASGLVLNEQGREAADRARARLLSPW